MQRYVKNLFYIAVLFLIANTVINFSFFRIQTVQAHIYVVLLEALLLFVIYQLVKAPQKSDPNNLTCRKFIYTGLFISGVSVAYKWLFSESLSAVLYVENFSQVFPFATGPAYGLKPVADASIDVIANTLYQCGFCVREDEIPLNEPFIAYLYYGISLVAGEFNHAILWLTLHAANLLTAAVLLKTAREIFPSIKYPQSISVLYVLMPGVFGVSLVLFKDGFIALVLLSIFYLNARYVFQRNLPRYTFEVLSVLLLVLLYQLRSGMLAGIICFTLIACTWDRRNWLQHIRILFLVIFALSLVGSNVRSLDRSLARITGKVVLGSSFGLDVQNLTYTTSVENSIPEKLGINKIEIANFFYAPFVKSALYFLLPLPVNKTEGTADLFQKISTLVYAAVFSVFLIGLYKIVIQRRPEELYLVAVFCICMALILGAGPIIYPRYRIMVSAFFLLIAGLGASRISSTLLATNLLVSASLLAVIALFYQDIYKLMQWVLG